MTRRELLRHHVITESDARSVRRTLFILHRDGFLYRVSHLDSGHERGGAGYVYGLSAKGVSHALRNGYSTSATKTLDEHSVRTLDHELEITEFHIALHRRCSANISGICGGRRTSSTPSIRTPSSTSPIRQIPARPSAISWRSNARNSAITGRRTADPSQAPERIYNYFNSTDCEKEWGFRQYRVVVVQRTDARREGLSRRYGRL